MLDAAMTAPYLILNPYFLDDRTLSPSCKAHPTARPKWKKLSLERIKALAAEAADAAVKATLRKHGMRSMSIESCSEDDVVQAQDYTLLTFVVDSRRLAWIKATVQAKKMPKSKPLSRPQPTIHSRGAVITRLLKQCKA